MAHVGFPHRLDPPKYAGGPAKGGDQRRPERRLHTLQAFFAKLTGLLGFRAIRGIPESALTAANRANTSPRRRIDVRVYGTREVRVRRIGNKRRSRSFLLTPVPTYSQAVARHRRWPQHTSQTYCTRIKPARSMGSLRHSMLEGPRRVRSWVAGAQAHFFMSSMHLVSQQQSREAHCAPVDLDRHRRHSWRYAAMPSFFFNPGTRLGDKSPPAGEVL